MTRERSAGDLSTGDLKAARRLNRFTRARRGGRFGAAALGLGLALGACGDATVITKVSRDAALDEAALQKLAIGGAPVEIHGLPWPGAEKRAVAGQLRFPNAFPPSARFRLVDARPDVTHRDRRMVLIFNGAGPNDEWAACAMGRNKRAFQPRYGKDGKGFEVFAVFCDGRDSIGRGTMNAPGAPHGDWARFQNEMRRLIRLIATDFKGGDER